jgi:hypothetical protein
VTTLTDADQYSRDDLAELYHQRWLAEISQPYYLQRCACISAQAGTTVCLRSREDGDVLYVFSASRRGCKFVGDGAIALRFLMRTQLGQA